MPRNRKKSQPIPSNRRFRVFVSSSESGGSLQENKTTHASRDTKSETGQKTEKIGSNSPTRHPTFPKTLPAPSADAIIEKPFGGTAGFLSKGDPQKSPTKQNHCASDTHSEGKRFGSRVGANPQDLHNNNGELADLQDFPTFVPSFQEGDYQYNAGGIYANPQNHGPNFEGPPGFQGGQTLQGNYSYQPTSHGPNFEGPPGFQEGQTLQGNQTFQPTSHGPNFEEPPGFQELQALLRNHTLQPSSQAGSAASNASVPLTHLYIPKNNFGGPTGVQRGQTLQGNQTSQPSSQGGSAPFKHPWVHLLKPENNLGESTDPELETGQSTFPKKFPAPSADAIIEKPFGARPSFSSKGDLKDVTRHEMKGFGLNPPTTGQVPLPQKPSPYDADEEDYVDKLLAETTSFLREENAEIAGSQKTEEKRSIPVIDEPHSQKKLPTPGPNATVENYSGHGTNFSSYEDPQKSPTEQNHWALDTHSEEERFGPRVGANPQDLHNNNGELADLQDFPTFVPSFQEGDYQYNAGGIYANPQNRGPNFEGPPGFQEGQTLQENYPYQPTSHGPNFEGPPGFQEGQTLQENYPFQPTSHGPNFEGPPGFQAGQILQGNHALQPTSHGPNFEGPTGFQEGQTLQGNYLYQPTSLGPNFEGPTGFQEGQTLQGNYLYQPTSHGPNFEGPTGFQGGQTLQGNYLYQPTSHGPNFEGPPGFQGVQTLQGNYSFQPTSHGPNFEGPPGFQGGLTLQGNYPYQPTSHGPNFEGPPGFQGGQTLQGNYSFQPTSHGPNFEGPPGFQEGQTLQGNYSYQPTSHGPNFEGPPGFQRGQTLQGNQTFPPSSQGGSAASNAGVPWAHLYIPRNNFGGPTDFQGQRMQEYRNTPSTPQMLFPGSGRGRSGAYWANLKNRYPKLPESSESSENVAPAQAPETKASSDKCQDKKNGGSSTPSASGSSSNGLPVEPQSGGVGPPRQSGVKDWFSFFKKLLSRGFITADAYQLFLELETIRKEYDGLKRDFAETKRRALRCETLIKDKTQRLCRMLEESFGFNVEFDQLQ